MEKETKQKAETSNSPSQSKWRGVGLAAYIIAIIFCVLESIGMLVLFIYGIILCTNPSSAQGGADSAIIIGAVLLVVSLIYLAFGITATTIICKRTKAGAHLNLALSICSIIFFNIVVGILATIYSTQVPVNQKSTA